MKKKIFTLATTSICTLGIAVTAFGGCAGTESTAQNFYVPTFSLSDCGSLSDDTKNYISDYINCLKDNGISCDENGLNGLLGGLNNGCIIGGNGCIIGGSCETLPDIPSIEIPGTPETPEATPDEKPETPEVKPEAPEEDNNENDTVISAGQTATEAAYAAEVVKLVNEQRAANGLSAVTQVSKIQAAAQVRSHEQVQSFSHTRPDGRSCFTALTEAGVSYNGAGENIAYGQKTPEEVVTGWMNSDGHRANILSQNFKNIGVGCYIADNGTIYWTQLFTY